MMRISSLRLYSAGLLLCLCASGGAQLAWGFAEEPLCFRDPAAGEVWDEEISTLHSDLVYAMALAAGFSDEDASRIMIWNQLVDSERLGPGAESSYTNCLGSFKAAPNRDEVCPGGYGDGLQVWPRSYESSCTTSRFGPYSPFFHFSHLEDEAELGALREWGWGRVQTLVGYSAYAWGRSEDAVLTADCRHMQTEVIDTGIIAGSLEAFATYLHSLGDAYSHRDCIESLDARDEDQLWGTHTVVPAPVPSCYYVPSDPKNTDAHGQEFGPSSAGTDRPDAANIAVYEELVQRSLAQEGRYHPIGLDTPLDKMEGRPTLRTAFYRFVHNWDFKKTVGNESEYAENRRAYAGEIVSAVRAQRFVSQLSNPVYALWNGYLNMVNILELTNTSQDTISITVTMYDIEGQAGEPLAVELAGQGQRDLILNDLPVFARDSYGIVKISGGEGSLDGRAAFYRYAAGSSDYEFAFYLPFENVLSGTNYVSFNTYQPSTNGAEQNNQVSNWLSIVNLNSSEARSFTVSSYDQTGQLLASRAVAVPAFGRRDIDGGHGFGPGLVGLQEIRAQDAESPYLAQLVRYGANAPAGEVPLSYSFAFPLLVRPGGTAVQWVPISSGAGGVNWVEVVNTANQTLNAQVSFYDNQGNELLGSSGAFSLAAHAQRHLSASSVLAAGGSGAAKIETANCGEIIAQSMFYFFAPSGSVSAMYGSQSGTSTNGPLTGSWNLFLGMNNWLRLFNTGENQDTLQLTISNNGQQSVKTITLNAMTGTDLGLHQTTVYGTSLDNYGLVSVNGNSLTAELLRLRPASGGGIDFAAPVKMRP